MLSAVHPPKSFGFPFGFPMVSHGFFGCPFRFPFDLVCRSFPETDPPEMARFAVCGVPKKKEKKHDRSRAP